jgi:hypothetical protein
MSPEESFIIIPVPDNPSAFSLQTARDKFLNVDESSTSGAEIRGDVETITFNTTFRIRMQARYKPRLKASKEEKALQKISRKELEELIGRKLNDDEVRRLKKSRREGNFHETALDMKVKSSHDKYASLRQETAKSCLDAGSSHSPGDDLYKSKSGTCAPRKEWLRATAGAATVTRTVAPPIGLAQMCNVLDLPIYPRKGTGNTINGGTLPTLPCVISSLYPHTGEYVLSHYNTWI